MEKKYKLKSLLSLAPCSVPPPLMPAFLLHHPRKILPSIFLGPSQPYFEILYYECVYPQTTRNIIQYVVKILYKFYHNKYIISCNLLLLLGIDFKTWLNLSFSYEFPTTHTFLIKYKTNSTYPQYLQILSNKCYFLRMFILVSIL